MTVWTVIVELDVTDDLLAQTRKAIMAAVQFETGSRPTTRTIRSDAFRAALGDPYVPSRAGKA